VTPLRRAPGEPPADALVMLLLQGARSVLHPASEGVTLGELRARYGLTRWITRTLGELAVRELGLPATSLVFASIGSALVLAPGDGVPPIEAWLARLSPRLREVSPGLAVAVQAVPLAAGGADAVALRDAFLTVCAPVGDKAGERLGFAAGDPGLDLDRLRRAAARALGREPEPASAEPDPSLASLFAAAREANPFALLRMDVDAFRPLLVAPPPPALDELRGRMAAQDRYFAERIPELCAADGGAGVEVLCSVPDDAIVVGPESRLRRVLAAVTADYRLVFGGRMSGGVAPGRPGLDAAEWSRSALRALVRGRAATTR
jgi:hypothetical protein